MATALGHDQVRVVCYLRKPWDRKTSAHTQHVKRLMPVRILSRLQAFEGNVSTVEEQNEGYLGMLERWEQAFGLQRLIVRVLEKEQLHQGDLVADFLHAIGLPTPAEHAAYVKVENVNEMPGRDTLRVLQAVDLRQLTDVHHSARRDLIAEPILAGAESLGWNQVRARLLPTGLMRRFEAAMADQHAYIARRYLGRADGVLFSPVERDDIAADVLDLGQLGKDALLALMGAALEAAAGGREALQSRAAQWRAAATDPTPAEIAARGLLSTAPGGRIDEIAMPFIASLAATGSARLGLALSPPEALTQEQILAVLVEALIAFHGGRSALSRYRNARRTVPAAPGDALEAGLDEAGEWFGTALPSREYQQLALRIDQQLEHLGRVLRKRGFAKPRQRGGDARQTPA
jgi:hypothetical protein